jgi:hypothetical protein
MTEERVLDGNDVLTTLECPALEPAAQRCTADDVAARRALRRAVENVAGCRFDAALRPAAGRPYLYRQIRLVYDRYQPVRALTRPTRARGSDGPSPPMPSTGARRRRRDAVLTRRRRSHSAGRAGHR